MVSTKLNIGKIPISKGEYQEGIAYQRLNQVTMLGSTYQSKIDDNTSAPAQMGADGAVENINTDKWLCIAVGNVSAAKKVVYNNETSGLEAGNVQEAIDEVISKAPTDLDDAYDADLSLSDGKKDIVQFNKGHIRTKNFDSEKATAELAKKANTEDLPTDLDDADDADLSLSDGKKDIVQFNKGHIRTKNFDSEKATAELAKKANIEDIVSKEDLLSIYDNFSNNKRSYKFVHVGKNYEYQHIQDAINSCKDATYLNQYMVVVHNDIYINDISQLRNLNNTSEPISEDSPYNTTASYIIMKNFVNIMGENGRQVKIEVNIPSNQLNDKQGKSRKDHLHCCLAYGSFIMKDLYFKCTNTRYCVHQENGSGSINGADSNKVKRYINIKMERMKGVMNNYGPAYGVGLAPNLRVYMENCEIISHIAGAINEMHTHPNYDYPCEYNIKNCAFIGNGDAQGFSDLCSGKKHKFVIEGTRMSRWNSTRGVYGNFDTASLCHDIRNGGISLSGHGNSCPMGIEKINTLVFSTNTAKEITVDKESSACNVLFGEVFKRYNNCIIGSEYIPYSATYKGLNMGTRLGDCTSKNLQLVLNVGEQTVTFVFDKDYTNLSNTSILSEMRDKISQDNIDLNISDIFDLRRLYFTDEVALVKNTGNNALNIDDAVVKTDIGVMKQADDSFVYGIAAERIDPGSEGYVILRNHQKFDKFKGKSDYIVGKFYKFSNNGIIETESKSDADFICTEKSEFLNIIQWI
jgi:hypothetical protein